MLLDGGVTTIYVSDMERAVQFYSGVLGLKLKARYGDKWAEVDAGKGLVLGLHLLLDGSAPASTESNITIGFNVIRPIRKVVAELKNHGVKFLGNVRSDPHASIDLAFFQDPDGNPLYLCEYRADSRRKPVKDLDLMEDIAGDG